TTLPPPTATPDLRQGRWELAAAMPAPARSEMPAVTIGGFIYVPGGFGGETRLERFDPGSNQWQALADMPAGRHHLMATAYDDKLYVLGGAQSQSWTPTETVWRYDHETDTWETLTSMPEARLAGAAVTLDEKIYVAGGTGGSQALLAFSPDDGTWQSLRAGTQPREHVAAVSFNGEIWLIGGRWSGVGEVNTVEIYDPGSEQWRPGPSLNTARAGFAAAVVRGQILVAGGEVIINGQETLASVEILNPTGDRWEFGPDLPVPIHGVGGAVLEGQVWLPGGSIRAGAIENEGHVQVYFPQ
ncbi:MAG: kelch repeat-containing protein, partial [Anaerolineae bacterium]|nr:kelch repeat-containing protein [Anaerolineae bacterium]